MMHRLNSKHITVVAIALAVGLTTFGISQSAKPAAAAPKPAASPNFGTINFKSSVGSFKILGGADPAQGEVNFQFTGSVLVSGLDGQVVTSGAVRKEIDNKEFKKQVFNGKGSIKVSGKFRAIQFFGRDLSGKFYGFGIMRLYGEFDKNLNTGEVWYDGKEHEPWGTSGKQMPNPPASGGASIDELEIKPAKKP